MVIQISVAGQVKADVPNMSKEELKKFIEEEITNNLRVLSARLYVNIKNHNFVTDTTIELGEKEKTLFTTPDIYHKKHDLLSESW